MSKGYPPDSGSRRKPVTPMRPQYLENTNNTNPNMLDPDFFELPLNYPTASLAAATFRSTRQHFADEKNKAGGEIVRQRRLRPQNAKHSFKTTNGTGRGWSGLEEKLHHTHIRRSHSVNNRCSTTSGSTSSGSSENEHQNAAVAGKRDTKPVRRDASCRGERDNGRRGMVNAASGPGAAGGGADVNSAGTTGTFGSMNCGFNAANWQDFYHENASRNSADQVLRTQAAGTFLIRPSVRIPGDLVLTVSEPPKIKHYLITKLNQTQQYKIGDQIFGSMSDLLLFYTRHLLDTAVLRTPLVKQPNTIKRPVNTSAQNSVSSSISTTSSNASSAAHNNFHSSTLKPSVTISPNAPQIQRIAHSKQFVVGLYDFESTDPEDLPFKKGDRIEIVEKQEEQWWTGKNSLGRVGHIPVPYIKLVPQNKHVSPGQQSMHSSSSSHHSPQHGQLSSSLKHTFPVTSQQASSSGISTGGIQIYEAIMRRVPNAYDQNALALEVGDRIQIYEKRQTGQWVGKNLSSGKEGQFPFTHVKAKNIVSEHEV